MKDLLLNGLPAERRLKGYVWLVAIVLLLVGAKFAGVLPGFVDELPLHLAKSSIDTLGDAGKAQYTELVPADLILDTVFFYIRDDLGFSHVTRFFSKTLKGLINIFDNILRGGNKGFGFSTPPWIALVAIALVLGYSLKGWRLALLSGGTVVYFAVFGLWKYAMETLALLAAAGPISIVIGLLLGILAYKKKGVELSLLPILSVAQTLPHLAYLIPVVVFFGIGHQTGVIATIIFAVPPMVRLTLLGLQKVPPRQSRHLLTGF